MAKTYITVSSALFDADEIACVGQLRNVTHQPFFYVHLKSGGEVKVFDTSEAERRDFITELRRSAI